MAGPPSRVAITANLHVGCPAHVAQKLPIHHGVHHRPSKRDVVERAIKGELHTDDTGTVFLLVRRETPAPPSNGNPASRRYARLLGNEPVCIYVPMMLVRPWVLETARSGVFCHFRGFENVTAARAFLYRWVGMEVSTRWRVRRCLLCQGAKIWRQTVRRLVI